MIKFNAIAQNASTHDNTNDIESAVNGYVHSLNLNEHAYLCTGSLNACYYQTKCDMNVECMVHK